MSAQIPAPTTHGPSPCPPDEVLAGWAEGALPSAARVHVETHLPTCAACRDLVADVAQDVPRVDGAGEAPRAHAGRILRWKPRALALAAGVLLAVGAGIGWFAMRPPTVPIDADTQLVALAADLRRERPDLVGDFAPLSSAERRVGMHPTRGGLVVFEPSGIGTSPRPEVRWSAVRGATRRQVVVRRADGVEVLRRDVGATPWPWPADAPDLTRGVTYEVEVTLEGPTGPANATGEFRVPTATEESAFDAALALVRARAPQGLGDLAGAHLAVRRQRWSTAEALVRASLATRPGDPQATELLAHVLARRGAPAEAGSSR